VESDGVNGSTFSFTLPGALTAPKTGAVSE